MVISVFYFPGPFLINSPHVLGLAAAAVEFECGLGRSVRSLAVRSQSAVRSESAESAENAPSATGGGRTGRSRGRTRAVPIPVLPTGTGCREPRFLQIQAGNLPALTASGAVDRRNRTALKCVAAGRKQRAGLRRLWQWSISSHGDWRSCLFFVEI